MRRIAFATALIAIPFAASAQQTAPPPGPICVPYSFLQDYNLKLQASVNDLTKLSEVAGLRLADTLAKDAAAKQKSEDDATTTKAITDAVAKAKADQKAEDLAATQSGTSKAPTIVAPGATPVTAAPKP